MQEGTAFSDHFNEVYADPLQMPMGMVRAGPENGWRNQRSVILEVKEMQLQRAE
jgi:hypothetical protein